MPFYLDSQHPSAVSFLTPDMPRPEHLRRVRPYGDQDACYRTYIRYYEGRGPAPHLDLIEAEKAERDAVVQRAGERAAERRRDLGLQPWGAGINAPQAADLGRFMDALGVPLQAPLARHPAPREYTPPNEVIITSIQKQPLFMPYDNLAEARLRLRNSVIRLEGSPIHVLEVQVARNGRFTIQYRVDDTGELLAREYSQEAGFDLAPLPARYVLSQVNHKNANWAFRMPARGVYQQGGSRSNTHIRRSGDGVRSSIGNELNIVNSYKNPNDIRGVEEAFKKVGASRTGMPCSDHVAVYAYGGKVGVEYHGIHLANFLPGDFSNGGITVKTEVPLTPLMEKRINEVGIKIAS